MRLWNRFSQAFAGVALAVFAMAGVATLLGLMASAAYVTFAPAGDRLRLALITFLGRSALLFVALLLACGIGAWSAVQVRAGARPHDDD